jgi:hypothetical protein
MGKGIGMLVAMVLSGIAGWWLNGVTRPEPASAAPVLLAAANERCAAAMPAAVAPSLAASARAPAPAQTAPAAAACIEAAPKAGSRSSTRILQAIREGDENARHEGLIAARSEGVAIPDETLSALLESDPSDRIRLLALDRYVEARGESYESVRAALQAALAIPSTVIHAEATRRLASLDELERMDASSAQQPH